MRHARKKGKLSRDASHRRALLSTMSKQLIQHERIRTPQPKAKALKPEFEKLITLAKRGDLHARRQALSELRNDKFAVHKLFEEIAPRYAQRPGGYTRIVKLGPRRSDSAEMVFLELV
jgi:large subunit ribosomal protein L17